MEEDYGSFCRSTTKEDPMSMREVVSVLQDVRDSVPETARQLLVPGEKVYFYGSSRGCVLGPSSYVMVTDTRALGQDMSGGRTSIVDIPLSHVSSVRVAMSGGCMQSTSTVQLSSGTATNAFGVRSMEEAHRAANIIQQAMRELKSH